MSLGRNVSHGFSAVELLITLFIAAAFLTAGYQLFDIIINDSSDTQAESRASNVAYDYLRRYSDSATNPCTTLSPLANSAMNVEGLKNASMTIAITCPQSDAPTISKVEATITYDNPTKTVRYATFVDKSKGASPVVDVTTGLVSRWLFNGNANSDVGNANGTVNGGAVLTTNRAGQANAAYSFNGATQSQNITAPSTFGLSDRNATISLWVYTASSSTSGIFVRVGAQNAGFGIGVGGTSADNNNPGPRIVVLFENIRWIDTGTTLGTGWHHVGLVLDATGVPIVYRDGTLVGSYNGATSLVPNGDTTQIGGYTAPASNQRWCTCSLDDVRIYNRALSASEMLQVYNGGPK